MESNDPDCADHHEAGLQLPDPDRREGDRIGPRRADSVPLVSDPPTGAARDTRRHAAARRTRQLDSLDDARRPSHSLAVIGPRLRYYYDHLPEQLQDPRMRRPRRRRLQPRAVHPDPAHHRLRPRTSPAEDNNNEDIFAEKLCLPNDSRPTRTSHCYVSPAAFPSDADLRRRPPRPRREGEGAPRFRHGQRAGRRRRGSPRAGHAPSARAADAL